MEAETIKNETNRAGRHQVLDCRVNSVAALLRHHGVDIDPIKLLFIGGGYGIAYDEISLTIDDETIPNLPLVTIGCENIEEKILDALGVLYTAENIPPTQEGHERILALLGEGKQILARTDLRAGAENADPNESFPIRPVGTCVFTDYDPDTDEYVLFWSNNNIDEKSDYVRIKRDELNHYRGTFCLPLSPEYYCLYIRDAEAAKKLTEAEIDVLFKDSLMHAAQSSMSGEEFNPGLKQAYTVIRQSSGLAAVHDLRLKTGEFIKNSLFKNRKNEEYQDLAVFFFALLKNNLRSGSFTAYRQEFAFAVELYRAEHGMSEDPAVTKALTKTARLWLQMIPTCMKLQNGVPANTKAALYMLKLVRNIENGEKKLYPRALRLLDI